MKREFLQNLKSGDQPLSKEAIDAIMAENGRDIEAAKAPFADYQTVKDQLAEAQKTIMHSPVAAACLPLTREVGKILILPGGRETMKEIFSPPVFLPEKNPAPSSEGALDTRITASAAAGHYTQDYSMSLWPGCCL